MSDVVRVNGNQMSWGSIILKVGNGRFHGFTSIAYSDKRERVHAYGMGVWHAPRGRSRGKYTIDPIKLTGWKWSVALLRQQLAEMSPNGKSYGDVEFQVVVQYVETEATQGHTVVLDKCVWTANTVTDDESPDPLKEEIELQCMAIYRDELTLFTGYYL